MKNPNPARSRFGPQTAAGKSRSSKNALKHGLLSQRLILEGENREDFENLHRELVVDLRPQGAMEEQVVELLATQIWRSKRLIAAENALISRSPQFVGINGKSSSELPMQGLLSVGFNEKVTEKQFLFVSAMRLLNELSDKIKEKGVRSADLLVSLTAVYGNLEAAGSDVELIKGIHGIVVARLDSQGDVESPDLELFSAELVSLIQREIARLEKLFSAALANDVVLNSRAALILPDKDLERIIRYETHLTRQIDRTHRLLLRLQARRPASSRSTINLDLNVEE